MNSQFFASTDSTKKYKNLFGLGPAKVFADNCIIDGLLTLNLEFPQARVQTYEPFGIGWVNTTIENYQMAWSEGDSGLDDDSSLSLHGSFETPNLSIKTDTGEIATLWQLQRIQKFLSDRGFNTKLTKEAATTRLEFSAQQSDTLVYIQKYPQNCGGLIQVAKFDKPILLESNLETKFERRSGNLML